MHDVNAAVWTWISSGLWMQMALRVVLAAAIFAGFVVASQLASAGLRRMRDRSGQARPLIYIVEKIAGYGLAIAGALIGLSTLGVNLTSLAVFAGALGVGVGLGLQGVVREFVSGLVAIFDPQAQVGDFVELESGVRGEITEIGPRATRLRTNDGLHVIIPNSKLIEGQVINWTLKGGARRIRVPFSVAYGVDKAQVRDVVTAAAKALPFTMPDEASRRTQVWLQGFGDSALNFELVVWPTPDAVRRPSAMQAAYAWAIEDALREAGIEIPFPQRDIRVRSLFGREGDEAADSLSLRGGKAPSAPASKGGTNEAASAVLDEIEEDIRARGDAANPSSPSERG